MQVEKARERVGAQLVYAGRLTQAEVDSLKQTLVAPSPAIAPPGHGHGLLPWAGGIGAQPNAVFGRFGKTARQWGN